MSRDELIALAKEAGEFIGPEPLNCSEKARLQFLERFANLVAAKEREACIALIGLCTEECGMDVLNKAAIRARKP